MRTELSNPQSEAWKVSALLVHDNAICTPRLSSGIEFLLSEDVPSKRTLMRRAQPGGLWNLLAQISQAFAINIYKPHYSYLGDIQVQDGPSISVVLTV